MILIEILISLPAVPDKNKSKNTVLGVLKISKLLSNFLESKHPLLERIF